MAQRRPIGVFDSGVGGLSVWREVVEQAPLQDTIYVADQAHLPYGNRPLSEVQRFSTEIARFLRASGARVIVVACNTASAAALYELRRAFREVSFVGMEPAIKPATEQTRSGAVGVIATKATFQGELFASLVERYGQDVTVIPRVCPGLVEAVEAGLFEGPETEALLRKCLEPLAEAGVDQLVLGCTHYPFLRPAIERIVGEGVAVVDPAPAVARQTVRVLAERGQPTTRGPGHHTLLTTGDGALFQAMAHRLIPPSVECWEVAEIRWQEGRLPA